MSRRQIEAEEDQIENAFHQGLITPAEYSRQMRDLERSEREEALEAAEAAYEAALDDHCGGW